MTVIVAVLLIVLFITLADPVIRIFRLELRYEGNQQEKILEAKTEALDSDQIQAAMNKRAEYEAGELAYRIIGEAALPPAPKIGYQPALEQRNRPRGEFPNE